MFAGAGVEKNNINNRPVNLVDLFPTLFDLINVKQHPQTDGKLLVALMDNNPSTNITMDYAYHQYKRQGVNYMGYSIRTDRYRYTEWYDFELSKTKNFINPIVRGSELYDYTLDALETENLIDNSKYAAIKKRLKEK